MTSSSNSDKMSKEESKGVQLVLSFIARRDRQLYEWLKEFCKVTNMKPHEVILHALRAFRVSVEAGEILKNINAEEWQKIKMAVLFDLEVALKMASDLQALAHVYVGDIRKTIMGEMSEEYYLKRTYRERAKAFESLTKVLEAMAESMKKMNERFEKMMQRIEQVLDKEKGLNTTINIEDTDGKKKTQTS